MILRQGSRCRPLPPINRARILYNGESPIEGKSTGKDRQATEQQALCFRQQLIAPIEGCAERAMAWERRAAAGRQQLKAIVQTRGDQLNPKCGSACRREFNGKR